MVARNKNALAGGKEAQSKAYQAVKDGTATEEQKSIVANRRIRSLKYFENAFKAMHDRTANENNWPWYKILIKENTKSCTSGQNSNSVEEKVEEK